MVLNSVIDSFLTNPKTLRIGQNKWSNEVINCISCIIDQKPALELPDARWIHNLDL